MAPWAAGRSGRALSVRFANAWYEPRNRLRSGRRSTSLVPNAFTPTPTRTVRALGAPGRAVGTKAFGLTAAGVRVGNTAAHRLSRVVTAVLLRSPEARCPPTLGAG
jgi:hypothetical protein